MSRAIRNHVSRYLLRLRTKNQPERAIAAYLDRERQRLQILKEWYLQYSDTSPAYAFVVFSRDRPMQLHALLSSYAMMSLSRSTLAVLYVASNASFVKGYEECQRLFANASNIFFYEQRGEDSFAADLFRLLDNLQENRVSFLVDDIVFIRRFDISIFDQFDLRIHVPSLRLGNNIAYSYTMDQAEKRPDLLPHGESLFTWTWNGNEIDWIYPLSLDGHMFLRTEIRVLLNHMTFRSPNSLEAGLQAFLDLYLLRRGVCYDLPRLVNVPCNMVQKDFSNLHGNLSAGLLLSKWEEGYAIDIDRLRDLSANAVHVDCNLQFVKRPK